MTIEPGSPTHCLKAKGGRPSAMTDDIKIRVKSMLVAGVHPRDIAKAIGVDASTVYKHRAAVLAWEPPHGEAVSTE